MAAPLPPLSPQLSPELVAAFDEITSSLTSASDLTDTFTRVATTAERTVTDCHAASVSMMRRSGFVTMAATDDIARRGDLIQYESGEGPCLSAATDQSVVYTACLHEDRRWPVSAERLTELGVGSMLSARLSVEEDRSHTLGSINLYSMDDHAFDEQDQVLVVLLASLTSVVAHHARVRSDLERGLVSRQIIGEAVGILRAQHSASSEDAFGLLVTASNRMNLKLRTIAEQLVEGTLPYLPDGWIAPRHRKSSVR